MELVAKTIKTPVGAYPAPLDPYFVTVLAACQNDEDLFQLVETKQGFINPDALNEVEARGLYADYCKWHTLTSYKAKKV